MTELVEAVLLGLVIGGVLGGLGGGGAILTVPALVYVLGQSPAHATTGSLVIVGVTAVVAATGYVRDGRVRWRTALVLGLAGIPATWLGSVLSGRADPDLLLLGFAALMLLAAATMLLGGPSRSHRHHEAPEPAVVGAPSRPGPAGHQSGGAPADVNPTGSHPGAGPLATLATALGVGLLTGFFGVGGGFVVVPALVIVLRLPMTLAVGTSLVVVTLNSATSLLARVGGAVEVDWSIVAPFTAAAVAASFAGKRIADRLPAEATRRAFAVLLVLVAAYVAWHSAAGLLADDPAPTTSSATSPAEPGAVVDVAAARRALADGAVALDVRTPEEYVEEHVVGAINLDLSSPGFEADLDVLDPTADHVVYCASGRRAAEAISVMRQAGFSGDLVNGGGLDDLAGAGVRTR